MLGRNWLHQFGTFDNGATYALMILYGQNAWPYDHTVGSGPIEMATDGWVYWGKVVVVNGLTIDVPINLPAGWSDFGAAIWWPESATQVHDDVDLRIVHPNGSVEDSAISGVSVFERAEVPGSLAPGTWNIRIHGYDVTGFQVVYFAARVHT